MKRTIIALAKKSVTQTKKITWEMPKEQRKLKESWTGTKQILKIPKNQKDKKKIKNIKNSKT